MTQAKPRQGNRESLATNHQRAQAFCDRVRAEYFPHGIPDYPRRPAQMESSIKYKLAEILAGRMPVGS